MPDTLRNHAALILADTLGAILAGHRERSVAAITARHATGGVPLLGCAAAAPPPMAAFLTGHAGTAVELDEGNYAAGGHPAIHAIAPALAEAAASNPSGEALLSAIIAGYHAGSRIGHAMRLRPAAHPHGTWGVVGAAAAVATLRGYPPARLQAALELAASLGLATSVTASLRGGSVRNIYAGAAAQNGLLAVDLLEAGVTGEPGGIPVVFGQVIGEGFDAAAYEEAATRPFILEAFLKTSACCRETQGALEAIELLLAEAPLDPAQVTAIEVATFASAATLAERAPVSPIAGRFSIPFTVATRILHGHAWVEAFAEAAIADPATRALAAKVSVREEPAYTARQPAERVCTLVLRLADGTVRERTVIGTPGDPDRPLPEAAMREKFRRMVEPGFGPRWTAMWEMARGVDGLPRCAELIAAFRP
ncbi:MmgE/PrpD family protein [Siccirubricoccus sp. KC 17139]|uniref:MmgE/PrpD family protein n=1 Tax=Siccirubricoccus soli TaxID=2899147 RepID=A0ABT1D508_9PROT|nr:MmgE/PrpD family protein [Siccirubricoccus soli]MCO6417022.1 MmgE/PrpD family protein [Siccirubricoccus soli]MCP2683157.1 MmgE/PrpD family protein [Siccirubricoccus soli]